MSASCCWTLFTALPAESHSSPGIARSWSSARHNQSPICPSRPGRSLSSFRSHKRLRSHTPLQRDFTYASCSLVMHSDGEASSLDTDVDLCSMRLFSWSNDLRRSRRFSVNCTYCCEMQNIILPEQLLNTCISLNRAICQNNLSELRYKEISPVRNISICSMFVLVLLLHGWNYRFAVVLPQNIVTRSVSIYYYYYYYGHLYSAKSPKGHWRTVLILCGQYYWLAVSSVHKYT